jgi:hypothetical protein
LIIKKIYIDKKENNRSNPKVIEYDKNNVYDLLMWFYALALPFLSLTSAFSDVYRASLYFSIVGIILIPNMIICIKDYLLRFGIITFILSFMLYYAYIRGLLSVMPYKTFF